MTTELYSFRNREGTLIILYELEERLACDAAQTLLHRVSTELEVKVQLPLGLRYVKYLIKMLVFGPACLH